MAKDNRLVTENFMRLNFPPKTGVTPGINDTLTMNCDQVKARYSVVVSGITTTGNRLPSQNQVATMYPITISQISFPVLPDDAAGKMTVRTNVSGSIITERGICYNTTGSPDINSSKTLQTAVEGVQTTLISGLTSGAYYYFTAYAKNDFEIVYLPWPYSFLIN
jgi:hypothetical protein